MLNQSGQLLTRAASRKAARPALSLLGDLSLPLARAHEICGNARRLLAALIAARLQGQVFWIAPEWQADRLNPESVSRLFDPGRLLLVEPTRPEDLLWCLEEALRSGVAPLVVADIPAPPGLVAVRRLHLAAETAATESGTWPLGLLLTPGQGGAPGIETRWHIAARHGQGSPRLARAWQLDRLRARTEPQKSWQMTAPGGQFRLHALGAPDQPADPVAAPKSQ